MSKYVIIGNSAAAVGCVEGIRQIDRTGSITILSSEAYHTYSRPLISYLLLGKTDEQRMKYRPDDFYQKNGCEVRLGARAASIDAGKRVVTLTGGEEIAYEQLLVATGSKPFVPPMEGLETVRNKFSFMSLDDAKALDAALAPGGKVLIVGAGLIGLKCAEGIAKKAGSITVVDLAGRILPSILDEEGSVLVQKHLEAHGIRFYLSDSVASFAETSAVMKSGTTVDFDVLVVAVGVRPNTELVQAAGGAVKRGIETDERCQTTLAHVYAAGDCAESYDITTGTRRPLALLPNAYMQGECAGINMAGGYRVFDHAMPMNAIGFFGYHMITAGSYDGDAYTVKDGENYKKLFTKDGLLCGFILIGAVERAGIYTSLIRERTPLSTVDFGLICEKPQLMAFTKRERAAKLGGRIQ